MNLYDQLTDWIKTNYTALSSDWLYFNAIRMDIGSNSVNSVSGNMVTQKYTDGSTENELTFAIALIRLYSAEMSDDNVNAINDVSNLVEWFKTETTLPDFGADKVVNSIEITQNIPDVVVDQDAGLCKYQILGKVQFLQTV